MEKRNREGLNCNIEEERGWVGNKGELIYPRKGEKEWKGRHERGQGRHNQKKRKRTRYPCNPTYQVWEGKRKRGPGKAE